MVIVPIGREDAVLEGRAYVTYGLIALNVLMFVLFCIQTSNSERHKLIVSWRSTTSFLRERPYLHVPRYIVHLMPQDLRQRVPVANRTANAWDVAHEQGQLNEMASELQKRYEAIPDVRMAYVPVVASSSSLLTSMFLHAGLLHLLGNMLFLFATAPFVEDAFGKPMFIVLYLSGGVVATLAFAARAPESVIPLVGASGAIAAVMGAYLVCFYRSRMEFLFIPFLLTPQWHYRFTMPAVVFMPLWFLEQVAAIPSEGDSGVAVTAHVAGFGYGFLFALAFGLVRYLAGLTSMTARPASSMRKVRLADVQKCLDRGELERAQLQVTAFLTREPLNREALRLALDVALRRRDLPSTDAFGARLLAAHASAKDRDATFSLAHELTESAHAARLPQVFSRAAEATESFGDRETAISLLERLCALNGDSSHAVPALVRLASLRRASGDVFGARAILCRALNHPRCSADWKQKISSQLATS